MTQPLTWISPGPVRTRSSEPNGGPPTVIVRHSSVVFVPGPAALMPYTAHAVRARRCRDDLVEAVVVAEAGERAADVVARPVRPGSRPRRRSTYTCTDVDAGVSGSMTQPDTRAIAWPALRRARPTPNGEPTTTVRQPSSALLPPPGDVQREHADRVRARGRGMTASKPWAGP